MSSREQVEQLAQAARVKLSDEELGELTTELGQMLQYAQRLAEVDVTGTPEWTPPAATGRQLRADVPRPSLERAAALALSPDPTQSAVTAGAQDGFFRVPRTLDDA